MSKWNKTRVYLEPNYPFPPKYLWRLLFFQLRRARSGFQQSPALVGSEYVRASCLLCDRFETSRFNSRWSPARRRRYLPVQSGFPHNTNSQFRYQPDSYWWVLSYVNQQLWNSNPARQLLVFTLASELREYCLQTRVKKKP